MIYYYLQGLLRNSRNRCPGKIDFQPFECDFLSKVLLFVGKAVQWAQSSTVKYILYIIERINNQSRTNGPINAHLTIAQV